MAGRKGNTIGKISCIGCIVCFVGLLLCDYAFAGIIPNWWYIINAIFWCSILILGKNRQSSLIVLIELLLFVIIALMYYISVPTYSYKKAISVVQSEQVSVSHIRAEAPWKYQGFTDGDTYLIVFKGKVTEAFWFDPYNGNYGSYDIENRLPFLFATN